MSDSHGSVLPLLEIMKHNEDAKTIFFLGDGENDILQIIQRYPNRNIYRVRGNCDYNEDTPLLFTTTLEYSDVTITAVHGNLQNVKYGGLKNLQDLSTHTNANIILYGHTHKPNVTFLDGVHYINPGSVSEPRDCNVPTYAFIDISDKGDIVAVIVPVPV
jgi:putative phosphoesterase